MVKIPQHWSQSHLTYTWPTDCELFPNVDFGVDIRRFNDMHTPTLLMLGGDSPGFLEGGAEVVDAALPNSHMAIMPGQQHIAMYTAPHLFLHEVLTFLTGPR